MSTGYQLMAQLPTPPPATRALTECVCVGGGACACVHYVCDTEVTTLYETIMIIGIHQGSRNLSY